ncbi:hypothetical protein [Microtetraspora niveoalba]|uniref:hypothetical protein n=1 Tax=Microtetraspora niveoalba TaxID=46175 RepID=UPI00082A3428|nr:hypothetical protein [Microtetraspora niveoalba]
MVNMIIVNSPWLASACPVADVAPVMPMRGRAARAEALPGSAAFGLLADARQGIPAYRPAITVRRTGDEQQTSHTTNGGVCGSRYAWREPVTT